MLLNVGGGYILATGDGTITGIPFEYIEAMIKADRKYGHYGMGGNQVKTNLDFGLNKGFISNGLISLEVDFSNGLRLNSLLNLKSRHEWIPQYGIAQVSRNYDSDVEKHIIFQGLEIGTIYNVTQIDSGLIDQRSGLELMNTGIKVRLERPFSSEIIRLSSNQMSTGE